MEKFVALLLTCLYLTAFSGATVTVHYCAGSAASINLDEAYKQDRCNKCAKEKKSCCQTKQTTLKINGKHEPASAQYSIEKLKCSEANTTGCKAISLVWLAPVSYSYFSKKPASGPPVPIYISNCSYRI